jgi:hypothetical protein
VSTTSSPALNVHFPEADSTTQDREWCEVESGGVSQRIRFHDYHEIYAVPGLYEKIFYDHLECGSPGEVVGLLAEHVEAAGVDPSTLSGIDVGAGNGLVGVELRKLGAGTLIGVDIIPEAEMAADRDRPEIYDDYRTCDLTDLSDDDRRAICAIAPNTLTCVAALGFDDIPPAAFAQAYDLLEDDAWVAFNVKADFLAHGDETGFRRMIIQMLENGSLEELGRRQYVHRLAMDGTPLEYVALVGRKRGPVPDGWL